MDTALRRISQGLGGGELKLKLAFFVLV